METPSAGALTENVLEGQRVHCELPKSEYVPRGQRMQVEDPDAGAMDPAEHALQALEPKPLINPGGHCRHELESMDPRLGLYVPDAQGTQLPWDQNVPAGQG